MKRIFFLVSILIVASCSKILAGQADLFSYDAVVVGNEMAQLDQIEEYVDGNPGTTIGQMVSGGNVLASALESPDGNILFSHRDEAVLGIPGFLWGCLGGWVGILVVYLNGQDPHEVKQATIGCVAGSIAVAGCYASYFVWIASFWSFYSYY